MGTRRPGGQGPHPLAESIGRGEVLFNSKIVEVSGVPGLNGPDDVTRRAPARHLQHVPQQPQRRESTAARCHSTSALRAPRRRLDVEHLPVYTFQQKGTGRSINLTDPGRGLITGSFADLGKTKVPGLRDLKARAPTFTTAPREIWRRCSRFYEQRSDCDSSRKSGSTCSRS